jgi:membrane associated rhomboid family serine protease
MYYPDRPILMFLLFPIPAKYFVLMIGALAFMASAGSGGGGVAHAAHLGGLVVGFVYLKGTRGLTSELKSRYLRWKLQRLRRRFDVYSGGRRDNRHNRVH